MLSKTQIFIDPFGREVSPNSKVVIVLPEDVTKDRMHFGIVDHFGETEIKDKDGEVLMNYISIKQYDPLTKSVNEKPIKIVNYQDRTYLVK